MTTATDPHPDAGLAPPHAPKISVVLPVFNGGEHLPLLLASLRAQSETDLEIIAVDDGSTDDSVAVLRRFAAADPRLVIVENDHRGLSAARNAGLARARGAWIAFADSDDWLAPETFAVWCRQAQAQQVDLLIGNGFRFVACPDTPQGRPILRRQAWDQVLSGADWLVQAIGVREWRHYCWLQLIRRELLRDSRAAFIDLAVHEDIVWTLQLALAARRVGFARPPLYGYRFNPASMTQDPSPATVIRRVQSYAELIPRMAAIADRYPRRAALSRALYCHAGRESATCVSLIRSRLLDAGTRGELARHFLAARLHRILFRGARTAGDHWRAIFGSTVLRTLALRAALCDALGRHRRR